MLSELPRPARLVDALALHLATLGPAGRMPKAPGTWGSLAAAVLAPFLFLPLPFPARLAALLLLFPAGAWSAGRAEHVLVRLFDIAKPWPVRASERWLPGGWGIMIDDGFAGLYAMIAVLACRALL
jgi:phosphatidylglycerophosphatase A